jgi:DNA helicase-2/ATP-dependent DNA helicase PcrA
MSDFSSELSKLNTEQKQAVNYIEGPLLVIAGPGTGKTQLLSIRAANILDKTDALPENILCLTFTEAGSLEMRKRLIKVIGQDAYKITVSTYHGFGNEIISRNPEYFSGGLNLRPISKLKADTIIRELQRDLPFTSSLKDPELVPHISGLISDAKQALLTPEDLDLVVDANLSFIKKMSEVTKPLSDNLNRVSLSSVDSFAKLISDPSSAKLPQGVEQLASLWNSQLEEAIGDAQADRYTKSLTKWKAKYMAKDGKNLLIAKGADQNLRLKEFAKLYDRYAQRLKSDSLYDYDDMILLSIEALKKHDELRFNLQEKYLYIMLDEYQTLT